MHAKSQSFVHIIGANMDNKNILISEDIMFESKKDYRTYAKARAAKSKSGKNCTLAFISGGLICVLGECFFDIYKNFIDEKTAQTLLAKGACVGSGRRFGVGSFVFAQGYCPFGFGYASE